MKFSFADNLHVGKLFLWRMLWQSGKGTPIFSEIMVCVHRMTVDHSLSRAGAQYWLVSLDAMHTLSIHIGWNFAKKNPAKGGNQRSKRRVWLTLECFVPPSPRWRGFVEKKRQHEPMLVLDFPQQSFSSDTIFRQLCQLCPRCFGLSFEWHESGNLANFFEFCKRIPEVTWQWTLLNPVPFAIGAAAPDMKYRSGEDRILGQQYPEERTRGSSPLQAHELRIVDMTSHPPALGRTHPWVQ